MQRKIKPNESKGLSIHTCVQAEGFSLVCLGAIASLPIKIP